MRRALGFPEDRRQNVVAVFRGLARPGQRITDDSFVLLLNAHFEPIDFTLPKKKFGASWVPVIYTADDVVEESKPYDAAATVTIEARSVMVLQAHS